MARVLVTGGAGFVGAHVVRALLERGDSVRVLCLPSEDTRNLDDLDVDRFMGDVTDLSKVRAAVRGCELVVHLAALYALWHKRPEVMNAVNVGGTDNVLRAASEAGVRRVVHTSSIAVFGGQGPDGEATEQSPFRLGSTGDAYSISKYEAHQVALSWAQRGLDVVIAAPCGPVGPGDVRPTPTGKLILSAVNDPVVPIIETATNMIDVRDVATGHVLALEKGLCGETYLLGCRNVTAREMVELVFEASGIKKRVIVSPAPLAFAAGRAMRAYADRVSRTAPLFTDVAIKIGALGLRARADKAVRELGLPQTPLETAIRDAIVWWAKNGYVKDDRTRRRILSRS